MIKVINGLRYNTDMAEMIGSWDNGFHCTEFKYCQETLYVTKKGNFFVHGEGGAMSVYSEQNGDETTYGERIKPVDKDFAFEWASEYCSTDEIDKFFGDMVEDA